MTKIEIIKAMLDSIKERGDEDVVVNLEDGNCVHIASVDNLGDLTLEEQLTYTSDVEGLKSRISELETIVVDLGGVP